MLGHGTLPDSVAIPSVVYRNELSPLAILAFCGSKLYCRSYFSMACESDGQAR